MKTVLSSIALAAALCVASPAFAEPPDFAGAAGINIKKLPKIMRAPHQKDPALRTQTYFQLLGHGIANVKQNQIEISDVNATSNGNATWLATTPAGRFSCSMEVRGAFFVTCDKQGETAAAADQPAELAAFIGEARRQGYNVEKDILPHVKK